MRAGPEWLDSLDFKRVSVEDLEWWHETAEHLEWRWAKTYASHTPHWYLLRRETHLTRMEYEKAHRVIVTFGQPEKFYKGTNMYLHSHDGEFKWWVMGAHLFDHQALINRGPAQDVYGTQDAPAIRSVGFTAFDAVASDFDRLFDPLREAGAVWKVVTDLPLRTNEHPTYLDVGAGTGRALALKLPADSNHYTAVDPSLGMLNRIVLKHWKFKDLHSVTAAGFLNVSSERYDTVLILGATSAFLTEEELHGSIERADRQAVVETADPSLLEMLRSRYRGAEFPLSASTLCRIEVPRGHL